jgi:hypothetical protein
MFQRNFLGASSDRIKVRNSWKEGLSMSSRRESPSKILLRPRMVDKEINPIMRFTASNTMEKVIDQIRLNSS